MLKFASIVGYASCGPMYIESFLTIFGQCINVLNYKMYYLNSLTPKSAKNQNSRKIPNFFFVKY